MTEEPEETTEYLPAKEDKDFSEADLNVANSEALVDVEEEEVKKSGLSFAGMLGRHFDKTIFYIMLNFRYRTGGVPCVLYHWHVLQAVQDIYGDLYSD